MPLSQIMEGILDTTQVPDVRISGLNHDSRYVSPGEIFVALKGTHSDGETFIPEALKNGAAAIVGPVGSSFESQVPVYLPVDNPWLAFSRMAANYYNHPSRQMNIIGITGTNGKTTTAILLSAILNASGMPTAVLGTLGLHWRGRKSDIGYTTPEAGSLQRHLRQLVDEGAQALVMEASSHALDQHRVEDIDFNMAVFTNLTQDHLDYHGSMEAYLEAKLHLLELLPPDRPVVINLDAPYHEAFLAKARGSVISYGLSADAGVHPQDMGLSLQRTVANVSYEDQSFSLESTLIGDYNLENILAAAATALAIGITPDDIQRGIARVEAIPGRLEKLKTPTPGTVLIDYAHTPDAYTRVLGTIRRLAPKGSRIVTFFGCGGDRDRAKRPLMAAEAEKYSDQLMITSDNPRTESLERIIDDMRAGLTQDTHRVIQDRKAALHKALEEMTPETVLVILGKGREDYEIIGTEKVPHNDVAIVEGYGR